MAFGAAVAWWWWVAMPHPLLLLALAVAAAGYSAFLFAQAEGRDFWQSALLLPHLLAQAVVAGAAVWMLAGEVDFAVENWLALGLVFHALMICGEIALPHSNRDTAQAARFLTHRRAAWFWGGAMALGILLPLFSLTLVGEPLQGLAAAVALAGLYIYEHLWIEAGQAPPLS
jgi:formate-dependent nitrite reductase membrane component NrfD